MGVDQTSKVYIFIVQLTDLARKGNLSPYIVQLTDLARKGNLSPYIVQLTDLARKGMLSSRSEAIATYALCGFSNPASIGKSCS